MNRRLRFLALAVLATFLGACLGACGPGARGKGDQRGPRVETEAGTLFPVTARIPGGVTYAFVAGELGALGELIHDTMQPFGQLDRDLAQVEGWWRQLLGFSPISPGDLTEAGFDPNRNVALFSTKVFPTLLVPLRDPVRVKTLVDSLASRTTVVVSEHRGTQPIVWSGSGWHMTVVVVDDWLAIHMADKRAEPEALAWLDELLDTPASGVSLASEPDWQWSLEQAAARRSGLALLRVPAIWDAFRQIDQRLGRKADAGCAALDQAMAKTFGRVGGGAMIGDKQFDGTLFLELDADAVAATRAAIAPAPDGNYLALRASAAVLLSWGLDLEWLGGTLRRAAESRCGMVMAGIGRDLEDVGDPFAEGGRKPFTSYHLAFLGGSLGFTSLDLRAVGWLGVANDDLAQRWLGQLPGDRKATRVANQEAVALDLSDYRLAEPLRYALAGGVLRLGLGRELLEQLLAGTASSAAAAGATQEIGRFLVDPDKISDLATAAAALLTATSDEYFAQAVALVLSDFHRIAATAALEAGGARMTGGWHLR